MKKISLFRIVLAFFIPCHLAISAAPPQFSLYSGIVITIGKGFSAEIEASAMVFGEQTCCPGGLTYSFINTQGNEVPSLTFSCVDLGYQVVTVKGVDCEGRFSIVQSFVHVQDYLFQACDHPNDCYPRLRLLDGIYVSVNKNQTATVSVNDFDKGSSNPCGAPFALSFSSDPNDKTRTFACINLGQNELTIWATDNLGNITRAEVFVVVQDNLDLCGIPDPTACDPIPLARALMANLPADGSPAFFRAEDFVVRAIIPACAGGNNYKVSFSPDTGDKVKAFTCYENGTNPVELWVTGPNGKRNLVTSFVNINDYFDVCGGVGTVAPPNDNVCDALMLDIPVAGCKKTNWNINATAQSGEPVPAGGDCFGANAWCSGAAQLEHSVWFSFKAPASGSVQVKATGFDTQIAIWEAASCADLLNGNYLLVGANDDINPSEHGSSLQVQCLVPGQTYWLQVDGKGGANGAFDLELSNPGIPCSVFDDPIDCGADHVNPVDPAGLGEWLHFFNSTGDVIASINDQGQNLPEISLDYQINGGPVRTDAAGHFYLDRNWAFSPEMTFNNPVSLRLYFSTEEFDSLALASAEVKDLEDLFGTKISGAACGNYPGGGQLLSPLKTLTLNAQTLGLEFEIEGFSAFYLQGASGLTSSRDILASDLRIWPNPVSDKFFVELPAGEGDVRVEISSVGGKMQDFACSYLNSSILKISIPKVPSGIYLVKIQRGQTAWVSRFVKVK